MAKRVFIALVAAGATATLLLFVMLRSQAPAGSTSLPSVSAPDTGVPVTPLPPRAAEPKSPRPQISQPSAAPQLPNIAAQIEKQLLDGQILFRPSVVMPVNVPSTVLVRVSADPDADIAAGVRTPGYVVEPALVSYRMKAVLDAPPGSAAVTPMGGLPDGLQLLGRRGYAQWTWNVVPHTPKDFQLTLWLYAVIPVDGQAAPHLLLTREAKIRVQPSPLTSKLLSETGSFAGKVWARLPELAASGVASSLAAAVILLWRRRPRQAAAARSGR